MSQASTVDRPRSKAAVPDPDVEVSAAKAALADFALVSSFLALTFLLGIFPLKDTDFWWHLKAGDQIRQTGQVPTVDTFTFGAEGHQWIDLHWVFQVLLSWGYAHGGVVGLNLAKCALTTLAVWLLIGSRRRDWPAWGMLLAWLPALLVLSGRMYIRPETISLLYLAIVLSILFRWDRRPWLAFALPVVQVCWVNTQGLFFLEPILIGFALASAIFRPGAFSKERRPWWRKVGLATALTALACLCNPYGLAGAFYPVQLARTMSSSIFKDTIGELKPLPKFIQEVGLDSLPLQLHIVTFVLGLASFLVPIFWGAWTALADRNRSFDLLPDTSKGRKKRSTAKPKKGADPGEPDNDGFWQRYLFRGLLFASFSALSLLATRNSHQFAAVVGTVTAWNFGEWLAAIRARKIRLGAAPAAPRLWPRLATLAAIALVFSSVASGQFYTWAGEGRTIGLGEEPLWFPREAVKFAGSEGMPDRLVGFHNGHPALFEYYFAPEKKAYTDARLEVMGPELYKEYIDLSGQIAQDSGHWAAQLERMGRPSVLVDNVDVGNANLTSTLLRSGRWKLVWFDPIASVFVHDSRSKIVEGHAVDFAARHFRREVESSTDDPATLAATAKALRSIGSQCRFRPNGDAVGKAMMLLGLDYARKLREVDPNGLDGWKQAGLIEYIRDLLQTEESIPRFRMPFDPAIDLSMAKATYELSRALEIAPDDGYTQFFLSKLFQTRGMDEPALPPLEKFVRQPNKNLSQQQQKALAVDRIAALRSQLGPKPPLQWANLSELEQRVTALLARGWASTASDVMESAYPAESRPWAWADRLATLRLHLGQPARARAIWLGAAKDVPPSTRAARVGSTYLVEDDFPSARKYYREALTLDPNSFEAQYSLALLEQDAGRADEALTEGRLAAKAAASESARASARLIINAATPYAKPAKAP